MFISEWSWEAKARQLTNDSKEGDIVNVGYIADNHPHNYENARLWHISKVKYYPDGSCQNETTKICALVQFENGDVISW